MIAKLALCGDKEVLIEDAIIARKKLQECKQELCVLSDEKNCLSLENTKLRSEKDGLLRDVAAKEENINFFQENLDECLKKYFVVSDEKKCVALENTKLR